MNNFIEGILGLLVFGASMLPIFAGVAILYFIAMKTQSYWEGAFCRLAGIELEETETEESKQPFQRHSA